MIRRFLALAATAALVLGTSRFNQADESKKDARPLCPVSGKAAKAACNTAYGGGKVCFCSGDCLKEFEANTAKYTAKANHQLVVTGQAKEVRCPFTCKELVAENCVDVAGVPVRFCCKKCMSKAAEAKGDAQIDLVFGDKTFKNGFVIKKK